MKVADLEKGMLLECVDNARLRVVPSGVSWGPGNPMIQATWPSKHDSDKRFVKCVMYLGTREELGIDRSFWGRRYALVDGQTMIIDRESWRYIRPVKEKKSGTAV